MVMATPNASSDSSSTTRLWMPASRGAMVVAIPLFFVGLALGRRVGGGLVVLSGAGIAFSAIVLLVDPAGAGREFAAIYQRTIQGRVPWLRPPHPSQQLPRARFIGIVLMVVGLGLCAVGVFLLAGWTRVK